MNILKSPRDISQSHRCDLNGHFAGSQNCCPLVLMLRSCHWQSFQRILWKVCTADQPMSCVCGLQLGPIDLGRIDIKYRRVNCQPPVNMMVSVDDNSGDGGWIRMSVQVLAFAFNGRLRAASCSWSLFIPEGVDQSCAPKGTLNHAVCTDWCFSSISPSLHQLSNLESGLQLSGIPIQISISACTNIQQASSRAKECLSHTRFEFLLINIDASGGHLKDISYILMTHCLVWMCRMQQGELPSKQSPSKGHNLAAGQS